MSTLTTSSLTAGTETLNGDHHLNQAKHVICWRSIFSGILGALLVYFILSALGAGIGGFRIAHIIARGEEGSGLLTGAGVWLGFSAVASLFLGTYFATRISHTFNTKVGRAHGVIIAALFFAWLLHGANNSLGSLTQMTSTMSGEAMGPNGTVVMVTDTDAEKMARTVGDIGWVFFSTFVMGTGAAILGGYEAAMKNSKKPMHYSATAKTHLT